MSAERYDSFVAESPQGSIFATSWWLEAVAPARHGVALVENGGEIEAAWPYVSRPSYFGNRIEMPVLTPWLGVLFRGGAGGKLATRLGREKDLMTELAAQLPKSVATRARFHRNFRYWAPLLWLGFSQTTRYTFVLDDIRNHDATWRGFRDNIRSDVRKAERAGIVVETTDDVQVFWDVHKLTFARQGLAVPYSFDTVRRIDNACVEHGVRRILVARGPDGRVHAGAYLVWDDKAVYYLMGGGDPDLRSSGATALTLWEAIRFAGSVAPVFDFEGSMLEPVERFVRAFGARPEPYSALTRIDSRVLAFYIACRAAFGRRR